jgi:hypothetical protein
MPHDGRRVDNRFPGGAEGRVEVAGRWGKSVF